ncbi:ImmA/IrrE family metallo-endopeptidase [Bacillaceae bacterium S4-13-58]
MSFPNYTTSHLEDWVTKWYLKNKMFEPKDLIIGRIALRHGIYVKQKEMPSRYDIIGRYKGITLDARLPNKLQREQFFHELCHFLRHYGNQSMMPAAFRELQERDARHFTRYAALPHHMITNYDYTDPSIVQVLAEDFSVTEELCFERLLHIQRNQTTEKMYQ